MPSPPDQPDSAANSSFPPASSNGTFADTPHAATLRPALGPFTALTIVVGGVIGSGIFFKPGVVAAETGDRLVLALSLWIVCGVINLCGALSQAELAAMIPHAGGSYVYLREAYGRVWAFAWAWAEFWVVRTGAIAALAVAMTMSMRGILASTGWSYADADWRWIEKFSAIAVIVVLAIVNIAGVVWGGRTQNATTIIKVAFIVALAVLPFLPIGASGPAAESAAATASATPATPAATPATSANLWLGIGAALAAIMWTYDGWGNLTVVAEEVKSPERAVPLALAGGMLVVIALYVAVNVGLYHAASTAELAVAPIPAAIAFDRAFGDDGRNLLYAMLMISVFGALNQNILTGPRVLLAAGRDYDALAALRRIDPRTGTPAIAIASQSAWSCVLVLFGDVGVSAEMVSTGRRLFDVLTDYCIFGGSIFYLLAVLAVFVLRWKRPTDKRPYRTPLYPVVPAVFVLFYVWLLAMMAAANPREAGAGLAFVGVGVAVGFALGGFAGRRRR